MRLVFCDFAGFYRAFLTKNRRLGKAMLFCARRAQGLRPLSAPARPYGRAGVRRRRAPSARSLLHTKQALSRRRLFAAAGPSAAPACPPPALRPPQAPVFGRFGRGSTMQALFLNSRFFSVRGNYFGIIVKFILAVVCADRLPPALHHKAECSRSP